MTSRRLGALLALAMALGWGPASAHKPSDSYLWLTPAGEQDLSLRWDIALRDLETLVGLDSNADGAITWGELRARGEAVQAEGLAALSLRRGGEPCRPTPGRLRAAAHSDGGYASLTLQWSCPASGAVSLDYRLLAGVDPSHRGLLRWGDGLPQVLPPDTRDFTLERTGNGAGPERAGARGSAVEGFLHYLREGVWHIWIGADHLLFLFTLLLPAVWLSRDRTPASPRQAGGELLKVVTAFTVAHSITLGLAVLGAVQPSPKLVEAAIALSVTVAALNNLFPLLPVGRWVVAFGFGLIHGFGFANVLIDLGLPAGDLALALLGFNLGVEIGQLALVALVFPLLFLLRRRPLYRWGLHGAGSLAAATIGLLWFLERGLNLTLI